MPVQLNLKELFSTDSQPVLTDKLNFNFGKLIEQGVGDIGPQGEQGPIGPAGPTGATGPRGKKGSTIYTGSTQTAVTTALADDIFITTGGAFYTNVAVPNTSLTQWSEIFNIGNIIANLDPDTSPPSFYNKLFQIDSASVDYSADTKKKNSSIVRFVKNSGDDLAYLSPDGINYGSNQASYRNATLFLNNFDLETYRNNFTTVGNNDSELNSIATSIGKAIVTVYSNFIDSTDDNLSRYQLQLGSVFRKSAGSSPQHKITSAEENLRIRHYPFKNITSGDPITFYLSDFNAGGDGAFTNSTNASNSAFRFRTSQLDTVNSTQQHNQISVFLGGADALNSLAGDDPVLTNNGIMIERSIDPVLGGKSRLQLGFDSNGNANLITRKNLAISSGGVLTISAFTSALGDNKVVYFNALGTASEKTTAIGIGAAANSSLTVYGTKKVADPLIANDIRYSSDQVNLGTFTKNAWPTGSATSYIPRKTAAGSTNPAIAADLSSYIGFNSYFDEANLNMNFTYRKSGTTTYGSGSAFITTRDGSLHYVSYTDDPALVDFATSGSNLNDSV